MKTRKTLLLLFCSFISISLFAQAQDYEKELKFFLLTNSETKFEGSLYAVHLLTFNKFDSKTIGIYRFGFLGPHQKPYLAFFDGQKLIIKKEYSTYELLTESIQFISSLENKLTELEKAEYLGNIVRVIQENILPPGTELIEEGVIDY